MSACVACLRDRGRGLECDCRNCTGVLCVWRCASGSLRGRKGDRRVVTRRRIAGDLLLGSTLHGSSCVLTECMEVGKGMWKDAGVDAALADAHGLILGGKMTSQPSQLASDHFADSRGSQFELETLE